MNCIINHSENLISFKFDIDKNNNTRTVIIFNKQIKKIEINNDREFYGNGYTASIKEINYVIKYLTKGGFI